MNEPETITKLKAKYPETWRAEVIRLIGEWYHTHGLNQHYIDLVNWFENDTNEIDRLRQQFQGAEELAAQNWDLVRGLNKHYGEETAARQAAEQRVSELEAVLQEIAQLEWPRGVENDATAAFWMRDTARAIRKL